MRLILPIIMVVVNISYCYSQYVAIPDANFVKFLKKNFPSAVHVHFLDTNSLVLNQVTELDFSQDSIKNLFGIQFFDSLKVLKCHSMDLTELAPLPRSLKTLWCFDNELSQLPALPNTLEVLACENNQLTGLPSLPNSLNELSCDNNKLVELPKLPNGLWKIWCRNNTLVGLPTLPTDLLTLACSGNEIYSLPSLPSSLLYLACGFNNLEALPELGTSLRSIAINNNIIDHIDSFPKALEYIYCGNNQLEELPQLPPSLEVLHCGGNLLTGLPLLPTSLQRLNCEQNILSAIPTLPLDLTYLSCYSNQLETISDLPPQLSTLLLDSNQLTEMDISRLGSLRNFSVQHNSLEVLNLKNGKNQRLVINARNNPSLSCVSVDDPEFSDTAWVHDFDSGVVFKESCVTMSLNDLGAAGIQFFPNPSFGQLNIKYDVNIYSIRIYDLYSAALHEKVLPAGTFECSLDLNHLAQGTYRVVIEAENGLVSEILMLQ